MNRSVTNFYAQKFFKENADGFEQPRSRQNFSARRNFNRTTAETLKMYLTQALKGGEPEDVDENTLWGKILVLINGFNHPRDKIINKDLETNKGWIEQTANRLDEKFGNDEKAKKKAMKIVVLEKAKQLTGNDKYDEILARIKAQKSGEAVASAKEFSRRPAKNFADDANKEALKKANQAAAVQACCGSHKVEVMAKAEGYAQGIKSYAGEDKQEIKDIAKKFLEGKKLDEKEALKLFGKIFPNK